ncbi:MAG: TetR family transcriptional regulator [Bryobacteraceae bacterium]
MRDPQRTSQAILEAAEKVILRTGAAKATLDEVAREASISKGGVLHHFPSKEAVLVGVLQGLIARFEAEIESFRREDPEPRGAFTRAFLRATLKPSACCVDVFLALNAAYCYTPALVELHREVNARWQRRVEDDGIDPVHASIVRFAADGLWLARIHGVGAPSEAVRTALVETLLALTQGKKL